MPVTENQASLYLLLLNQPHPISTVRQPATTHHTEPNWERQQSWMATQQCSCCLKAGSKSVYRMYYTGLKLHLYVFMCSIKHKRMKNGLCGIVAVRSSCCIVLINIHKNRQKKNRIKGGHDDSLFYLVHNTSPIIKLHLIWFIFIHKE